MHQPRGRFVLGGEGAKVAGRPSLQVRPRCRGRDLRDEIPREAQDEIAEPLVARFAAVGDVGLDGLTPGHGCLPDGADVDRGGRFEGDDRIASLHDVGQELPGPVEVAVGVADGLIQKGEGIARAGRQPQLDDGDLSGLFRGGLDPVRRRPEVLSAVTGSDVIGSPALRLTARRSVIERVGLGPAVFRGIEGDGQVAPIVLPAQAVRPPYPSALDTVRLAPDSW